MERWLLHDCRYENKLYGMCFFWTDNFIALDCRCCTYAFQRLMAAILSGPDRFVRYHYRLQELMEPRLRFEHHRSILYWWLVTVLPSVFSHFDDFYLYSDR